MFLSRTIVRNLSRTNPSLTFRLYSTNNFKFTKSHEWLSFNGKNYSVGITKYAQSQLGDIVFVELPKVGKTLTIGSSFATVESVKAVSDIYSPVNGVITEVNQQLESSPELINDDPYGNGWIIKISANDVPNDILDEVAYEKHCNESS
eukprot:TRINITY_DN497_c2_g3_i1.p1 TRINITY_DN497_c2_g3~~TRINITY_DN497_c2_g3_i1.p1  ORF type:complete len:148 (-),score=43.66 TRINITY_DN497_c2_g3_i1:211-654(-)